MEICARQSLSILSMTSDTIGTPYRMTWPTWLGLRGEEEEDGEGEDKDEDEEWRWVGLGGVSGSC